ncbi:ABC transporter permease subunit [Streptomyces buecherae]|uniref:ABC transporter permease subunit n=1 Tax=Streptomyces buecherae TaxID=2763006 RepID=A0A7H8N705_9ACTN|nr:ABC transporter permease subunit [Streptomyces buecherae]QKW50179.1 ABC transporter permease subunit [Streptomyces buecherae]
MPTPPAGGAAQPGPRRSSTPNSPADAAGTTPGAAASTPDPTAPDPAAARGSGKPAPRGGVRRSARRGVAGSNPWLAALFLLPALVLLGALVVYPIVYSLRRSFFDAADKDFVGLDNFREMFTDDAIQQAVTNNVIWIVVAPLVATALGLIFAVLTERIRWGTAFKLLVFMPMAISMLAAGIIFRLVYEQDPDRGVANALWVSVHDTFSEPAPFERANPGRQSPLTEASDGTISDPRTLRAGSPVHIPLVGIPRDQVDGAREAARAERVDGKVTGTVWRDFTRGGKGTANEIDAGEEGLAGITVQAVKDGSVVASATTRGDGTFELSAAADGATLRLPGSNFQAPYNGVDWLGPTLVTPAIIGSYVWMWAGFAMVLIAAGLAGLPRELLEAARMDGANEWQVFRRITVPMLAPVLGVVLVTLMINVLKIFDLVYIIAPGASQDEANVLALQLYKSSFGTDVNQGVGSAIAIFLLLLVLPLMYVNVRRIRRERRR